MLRLAMISTPNRDLIGAKHDYLKEGFRNSWPCVVMGHLGLLANHNRTLPLVAEFQMIEQLTALEFDEHIVADHADRKNRNLCATIVTTNSSMEIECPGMPWTHYLSIFDSSLAKRTATMRTDIVHRGDRTPGMSDAQHPPQNGPFAGMTFGRQLRL